MFGPFVPRLLLPGPAAVPPRLTFSTVGTNLVTSCRALRTKSYEMGQAASNNYLIWGFASKVRLGLLGTGGGLDVIVGMC